jgi:hypothetical protein
VELPRKVRGTERLTTEAARNIVNYDGGLRKRGVK